MRIRMVLAGLAMVLLITSQAMSQNYAQESFEYPVAKVDSLSLDSLGTAANGWGGPWTIDTSASGGSYLPDTTMFVADTGFSYNDLYTTQVPYYGGALVVKDPGGWAGMRYRRALAKTWPDAKGQYWVSFLFQTNKTPTGNTYYLFKLYGPGAAERVAIGKGGGGTYYSCGSGWPGGAGPDVDSTMNAQAGPVWLVTEIFMTGTKADTSAKTYMWINPDPTVAPDTASANVKRLTNVSTGIDSVGIECGGVDTMQVGFDEIRLATTFQDLVTGVNKPADNLPVRFALSQNYPNPFNPTTQISYSVPKNSFVTLKVYNILGQRVATLYSGIRRPGNYIATFNASGLASGVYLYRLEAGATSITRKLMLLK